MAVTTADIKQLREMTGAGILDCKKALQESNGDVDQAVDMLRKKGLASAAKKASREANEGIVSARISDDGKTGVMVELNCETDFVARTDDFLAFVDSLVKQLLNNRAFIAQMRYWQRLTLITPAIPCSNNLPKLLPNWVKT